jgi:phosphatidylglycerol:prolipoprotein diacylglycerol transferase
MPGISSFSTFLAESFLHDLNPVIVELPGALAIRWYGVAYLLGFVAAWALLKWMGRTGRIAIPPQWAFDYITYGVVGVIIGGRLGYVLFYDLFRSLADGATPLLWEFTGDFPFWGVLFVWDGGMSFHGGLAGVIIALVLFAHRRGLPKSHVLDVATFITPPGLFFGRIANFINGELWGKVIPHPMHADAPWWSIKYPSEITDHWLRILRLDDESALRELTYRMAADFNLSAPDETALREAVMAEASRRLELLEPLRNTIGGSNDFHARVVEAAYAGNEAVAQHIQPLLTPYYPSQLFQACAEGLLLWLVLILIWLKPRRMGVVGSWFLIAYGILRIFTELFRQPDEGVALVLGLQRGQLLSALMIACGIVTLIIFGRKGPRIGGLIQPSPETVALRPVVDTTTVVTRSK